MATKLKQKRALVKTLSQMGLTTAKNLGGIANIEGKSNVDLLVSIPNSNTTAVTTTIPNKLGGKCRVIIGAIHTPTTVTLIKPNIEYNANPWNGI